MSANFEVDNLFVTGSPVVRVTFDSMITATGESKRAIFCSDGEVAGQAVNLMTRHTTLTATADTSIVVDSVDYAPSPTETGFVGPNVDQTPHTLRGVTPRPPRPTHGDAVIEAFAVSPAVARPQRGGARPCT